MKPSRRLAAGTALIALVFAGFYWWTAATGAELTRAPEGAPSYNDRDTYNLMAEGFLDGSVALPVEVPAGLRALQYPYDVEDNQDFRTRGLQDLVLYDDRLFSPWGPAPALAVYVPLHLVGVNDLEPRYVIGFFAIVGTGFLLALFLRLVGHFAPRAPPWAVLLGVAALAAGNVMPYLLRRPHNYEVALAGGFCFLFAGLFLLAREALSDRPRPAWLGAASLFVGLAFASRAPLLMAGLLLAGVAFVLGRQIADRHDRARLAAAVLGPFAAVVVLHLIYNAMRFGSPAEFGQPYVLAAENHRLRDFYSLDYVLPGLWHYLVAPPRLSLQFPYLLLPPPPEFPGSAPRIYTSDNVTGLVTGAPIVLMLLATPWVRGARGGLRALVAGVAAVALLVMLSLAATFWFAYMRYETDFAALLLLGALLVWVCLLAGAARWRRAAFGVAGALAATVGIAVSIAASVVGPVNPLPSEREPLYRSLVSFFAPIPTAITQIAGRPMLAAVNDDPLGASPEWGSLSLEGDDLFVQSGSRLSIFSPRSGVIDISGTLTAPPGVEGVLTVSVRGEPVNTAIEGRPVSIPIRVRRGLNTADVSLSGTETPPDKPARLANLQLSDDVRPG